MEMLSVFLFSGRLNVCWARDVTEIKVIFHIFFVAGNFFPLLLLLLLFLPFYYAKIAGIFCSPYTFTRWNPFSFGSTQKSLYWCCFFSLTHSGSPYGPACLCPSSTYHLSFACEVLITCLWSCCAREMDHGTTQYLNWCLYVFCQCKMINHCSTTISHVILSI